MPNPDADDVDTLWEYVVDSYPEGALIGLTNVHDRAATSVNSTVGLSAAYETIALWPTFAQVEFDADDATHLAVGKRAVIAVLWQRGGSSEAVSKIEWDSVFSDDGLIGRIRNTSPRARMAPETSGTVRTSSDLLSDGNPRLGWSDPRSLPGGILPSPQPFE